MTLRTVGIIMNGVTGRMGTNQHLIRSITAIRKQGGLLLPGGDIIMPNPILVGRNETKLRALADTHGIERWSTDLSACLANPEDEIYFDAQSTTLRADSVRAAIQAGKHIYCEKPTAPGLATALDLARLACRAGVKNGVVQDMLFLPGLLKLRRVIESGFFGRILSVRGEFGYWVFEGDWQPTQRPSWNYRKEDGGGIIIDMLCHWQYVLDNLFGQVQAVSCLGATHIPQRIDEQVSPTSALPMTRPTRPSSWQGASSSTSTRPGACASTATNCSPCKSTALMAVRWPGCVSAKCRAASTRRVPSGTRTSPTPSISVPSGSTSPTMASSRTPSRSNGSCSLSTSSLIPPSPGTWRQGPKGCSRDIGLRISSLCRGGWFPAATAAERQAHLDDNRRAIEEAATLGTDVLVLVCGPAADRDIGAACAYVEEAIGQLLPYATERGVKRGIEPLHPMYAADRSVIVTLAEANRLARRLNSSHVGVVIDAYHVWWDPQIYTHIAEAAGHILGFHVCDWLVPTPDMLLGRGMMGDGVIELGRLRSAVDAAGYTGPIEVEIFNRIIWDSPGDEVLDLMKQRYLACV